jgi:nitroreductase
MASMLCPTKERSHSTWTVVALLMLTPRGGIFVSGSSSTPPSAFSCRPTTRASSPRSSPTSSSSISIENAGGRNNRDCFDTRNDGGGNGVFYRAKSNRRARHRMTAPGASQDSNVHVGDDSIAADRADDHGHDGVVPLSGSSNTIGRDAQAAASFEAVVNARCACTRFHRHQEANGASVTTTIAPTASLSDPASVHAATQCLAISTRAPTGFNVQPYRIVLVHSRSDKENVARYCLGRNADRVRDSDCTAVFLADGECGRDWTTRRRAESLAGDADDPTAAAKSAGDPPPSRAGRVPSSPRALLKLRLLILLFSSGYPLPRFVSVPLSFFVRLGVSALACVARLMHSMGSKAQLLPTLSSAETWSQKNTMLVAMTYMLACTSRGLATCPMEGYDAVGIKRALGVPAGRYSIPLIVSTGKPYQRKTADGDEDETDDVGLSHGGRGMSPRYSLGEVVYGNSFGKPATQH